MREKLLDPTGASERDVEVTQFLFDHAVRTRAELAAAGKEAVSSRTRWRLPADHPDALPLAADDGAVRVLNSPAAVLVVVAGAGNAGVSAVVETFGPRGGPPPVTRVSPGNSRLGLEVDGERTGGQPGAALPQPEPGLHADEIAGA